MLFLTSSIQLDCIYAIVYTLIPSMSAKPADMYTSNFNAPRNPPIALTLSPPRNQLPHNKFSIPLRKRSIPRPRQSLLMSLPSSFMSMQSISLSSDPTSKTRIKHSATKLETLTTGDTYPLDKIRLRGL